MFNSFAYYSGLLTLLQRANEEFYHIFVERLTDGDMGNCALAIEEVSRPDAKQTKSMLMGNVLRLGDVENHPDEAIEISVKTSKCTALARPKSWKKFARMGDEDDDIVMRNADDDDEPRPTFGELAMQTRYVYDPSGYHDEDADASMDEDSQKKSESVEVEKEDLIRGYKYGTSYVPVPENNFPKLETKKGIDITGFIHSEHFRREWAMGEVQYVWADPNSPLQQVALSSVVRAMIKNDVMAIGRWVTKDGADPRMGILAPTKGETVDHLLWVQVNTPETDTETNTY
jgi:ATP-dependent DNA helicase 2 subunit 2